MKTNKHIYLDNIIFYLQKAGGISVYWYELQKRFIERGYDHSVIEQRVKNNNIFHTLLKSSKKSRVIYDVPFFKLFRYFPICIKLENAGIFHSSYYRVSLQKNIINIITVYDFTYEYYRSGFARWIHTKQKHFALKKADGIICISENTKKDLFKFFPDLKNKDIKVIHIAASEEFCKIDRLNGEELLDPFLTKKPFVLYVGDRKAQYKNFYLAVDVISKLENYHFVFVGGGPLGQSETEVLEEKIAKRYFHFQTLDGKYLNQLYNMAFCLLYPSNYEGFGIPVLEAMQAGCPVVSTNRSSIPEVAENAALLVDVIDTNSFVEKIVLLEDEEYRDQITKQGLMQAKKFSWDKCFTSTCQYYHELAQKVRT